MQTAPYKRLWNVDFPVDARFAVITRELSSKVWAAFGSSLPDIVRYRFEARGSAQTTLLITDLVNFSGLVESLGDSDALTVIHRHNSLLRTCLRAHGGREAAHTGDGVIAAFVDPVAAVRCAIDMQRRLARFRRDHPNTPLHARIGLHAGHALPEEGRLFGSAVIVAVRVCSSTPADAIQVSDPVRMLTQHMYEYKDRGVHRLKGLSIPQQLHLLLHDAT